MFVNPFAFIVVLEQNYFCCGTYSDKQLRNLDHYRDKRGRMPTRFGIIAVLSVMPSLPPSTHKQGVECVLVKVDHQYFKPYFW